MHRKFPRANRDDIEDAVAWAMVDLVDYWIQLPSSVIDDDQRRTFNQACWRAERMAITFLTQEWDRRDIPVEALSTDRDDAADIGVIRKPSMASPEDIVVNNTERQRFQAFMLEQQHRVGDWLTPFLDGTTTREQAATEGVTQSAIAYRWQRRLASLTQDARRWGFGAAT
jgi:hypothetical protein